MAGVYVFCALGGGDYDRLNAELAPEDELLLPLLVADGRQCRRAHHPGSGTNHGAAAKKNERMGNKWGKVDVARRIYSPYALH